MTAILEQNLYKFSLLPETSCLYIQLCYQVGSKLSQTDDFDFIKNEKFIIQRFTCFMCNPLTRDGDSFHILLETGFSEEDGL